MLVNIIFCIVIATVAVRTVSYGIYELKNRGKIGGISVFILSAGVIFTGAVIITKGILQ